MSEDQALPTIVFGELQPTCVEYIVRTTPRSRVPTDSGPLCDRSNAEAVAVRLTETRDLVSVQIIERLRETR